MILYVFWLRMPDGFQQCNEALRRKARYQQEKICCLCWKIRSNSGPRAAIRVFCSISHKQCFCPRFFLGGGCRPLHPCSPSALGSPWLRLRGTFVVLKVHQSTHLHRQIHLCMTCDWLAGSRKLRMKQGRLAIPGICAATLCATYRPLEMKGILFLIAPSCTHWPPVIILPRC